MVIVSGGDAESPFTTPSAACATGLAAGNTDTALREHLLAAGFTVFTSPAKEGPGQIESSPGFGGFAGGPPALPASMTVNAVGDIDEAGQALANFLSYLHESHGVAELDLVGHSMGGLFSRAAIRVLAERATPIHIRTLVTIGTPWQGSFAADYAAGTIDLTAANGNPICQTCMQEFKKLEAQHPHGAGSQVTRRYLDDSGWNTRQTGVLDDIPVTLIGGDFITDPTGTPVVFPNDGLVELGSALAAGVSDEVLPHRAGELIRPDVHSIFFADKLGISWQQALTWDPVVLDAVAAAIA